MTAPDLAFTSAAELARMIRAKQISATEVMRVTLKRAQDVQAACNCFITICADQALAEATAADKAIAKAAEPATTPANTRLIVSS
jgi:aspartyl-tRNA(Asn)/glutamyl-tRNA(Gln) amidotransferase subunit A